MQACCGLCVDEHASPSHSSPGEPRAACLTVLPWNYSCFWNVVGGHLLGLLGSHREKLREMAAKPLQRAWSQGPSMFPGTSGSSFGVGEVLGLRAYSQ